MFYSKSDLKNTYIESDTVWIYDFLQLFNIGIYCNFSLIDIFKDL
jgi:hypothetical protein